jgi:hypothetical protein
MTVIAPDRTAVVAGNGASLAHIPEGAVLTEDFILRTNSFFFEPVYHLGRRVDLAMLSGDPRVFPFLAETLWRCRDQYDLRAWSTHDPRLVEIGRRRLGGLYRPMAYADAEIEGRIRALCDRYQRQPTTGTLAVVMAHALGARRIVLAGIDLYTASRRYVYESGPHYRALMGHDSDMHAHDQRLHDRDLDRAILAALNERPEVDLFAASPNSGLAEVMDPAPLRSGPTPKAEPHDAPADWAPRAGLYPIWLLRGLRRARKLQRRLGAGLSWVGQGR